MGSLKLVCIADTHLQHGFDIPDGDVLIHAGDFTGSGSLVQVNMAMQWFGSLPHKYKIFCAGNHDTLFETDPGLAKSLLPPSINVHYLQDSEVTIEGVRFYGSPWQPEFCNWAFNLPRGQALKEKWDHIPDGIDVLITHGPPYRILDETDDTYGPSENVGCPHLREAVERIKPRIHVFGHIHNCYGTRMNDDTIFINASICDTHYNGVNPPIEITLRG